MKNNLIILLVLFLSLTSCNKEDAERSGIVKKVVDSNYDSRNNRDPRKSSYGIYGEVLWPVSGSPYNALESPTVYVYKYVNGSWVYHGSTTASACGYYTYDTGGIGTFHVTVGNYYYLRSYPGCATRVDYGMHAGSGDGTVTVWSPWTMTNIRCS